jgi:hypothetical protein
MTLDANGNGVAGAPIPNGDDLTQPITFNNPIGIATDPTSGDIYVAENGSGDVHAGDGYIRVIKPSTTSAPTSLHVNFQPASSTVPTGYAAETGVAFNGVTGWTDASGDPLDLTANTRQRAASTPPSPTDTFIHMQAPAGSGNTTPGVWHTPLADGQYNVTVGVGDANYADSVDQINLQSGTANAVKIINGFTPTTGNLFKAVTKRIVVSNGMLTVDAAGGTNTKLDYLDAVPVTPIQTSWHIDFTTSDGTLYPGYLRDFGQAYDSTRGYGWEDDTLPLTSDGSSNASLVGNGRQRNSSISPDSRYDTLLQMQQATDQYGGVTTIGRWEAQLANGVYKVTVGVGDANASNSVYVLTAERGTYGQSQLVNFTPSGTTAATLFKTTTTTVSVSDGKLTIDPDDGGSNDKIDFIDVVPAT